MHASQSQFQHRARSLGLQIVCGVAALAALGAPAVAQNDNCATPQVISGLGMFSFDTSASSTGTHGQANPFCTTIFFDVWFEWTAPSSGNATLMTCGQATYDTEIAVYPGPGCPTVSTNWCDDDACGLESLVPFQVTAGNVYMIQIGGSGAGSLGSGTFSLNIAGPPANDDCSAAVVLGTGGGAAYDNTIATSSPEGQGAPGCTQVIRDLWYLWTATQSGTATLDMCFQSVDDTAVTIWPGPNCPQPGATPIACDDDGCGMGFIQSVVTWQTAAGATYMIEVGSATGGPGTIGSFFITEQGGGSSGVPFCFGDGTGTACPCGNAGAAGHGCASSIAANGARVDAMGSVSVTNDTLVLQGTDMPPGAAALYFQGTQRLNGGAGAVFGDGLRCVAGTIMRLGIEANDGAGASGYGGPLGDVPISVRGQIPAGGGVRDYQVWYRNAAAFCTGATFNLSNGIEVTWAP